MLGEKGRASLFHAPVRRFLGCLGTDFSSPAMFDARYLPTAPAQGEEKTSPTPRSKRGCKKQRKMPSRPRETPRWGRKFFVKCGHRGQPKGDTRRAGGGSTPKGDAGRGEPSPPSPPLSNSACRKGTRPRGLSRPVGLGGGSDLPAPPNISLSLGLRAALLPTLFPPARRGTGGAKRISPHPHRRMAQQLSPRDSFRGEQQKLGTFFFFFCKRALLRL